MAKGCHLSEDKTRRIIGLLETTDMTIAEIAARMNCSRGTINALNRRYRVRDYAGHRSRWALLSKKMA
jgi:IS30 family transposase